MIPSAKPMAIQSKSRLPGSMTGDAETGLRGNVMDVAASPRRTARLTPCTRHERSPVHSERRSVSLVQSSLVGVSASSWVAVLIAGLGILGTLSATVLAQRGEAKRANRMQQIEATRRAEDRRAALEKERRDAIRNDYREVLRFVARTRLFVLEMRNRLAELEYWSARLSTDEREVEDLEARTQILRRRFLDELPDVQSLVGAWGPVKLISIFDEIDDFGPKASSAVSTAVYFKVNGKRFPGAIDKALGELDQLLSLLGQARDLLYAEQQPKPEQ
jgi:hypothetical protein